MDDGRTGLLYPASEDAGAIDELRAAVTTLAGQPGRRAAMRRAARASVLERDWDSIMTELVDQHYHALVDPRGTSAHGMVA